MVDVQPWTTRNACAIWDYILMKSHMIMATQVPMRRLHAVAMNGEGGSTCEHLQCVAFIVTNVALVSCIATPSTMAAAKIIRRRIELRIENTAAIAAVAWKFTCKNDLLWKRARWWLLPAGQFGGDARARTIPQ
jgi:hexokinase